MKGVTILIWEYAHEHQKKFIHAITSVIHLSTNILCPSPSPSPLLLLTVLRLLQQSRCLGCWAAALRWCAEASVVGVVAGLYGYLRPAAAAVKCVVMAIAVEHVVAATAVEHVVVAAAVKHAVAAADVVNMG